MEWRRNVAGLFVGYALVIAMTADAQGQTGKTSDAASFEKQWIELRALRDNATQLLSTEQITQTTQLMRADSAWMLRALAVQVLGAREATRQLASAGLDDAYPRVRAAALQIVAGLPDALPRIEKLATSDSSALVRKTALQALASTGHEKQLLAGLHDPSPSVRSKSTELIATLPNPLAYSVELQRILRNVSETPSVRAQTATSLGRICAFDAKQALLETLDETSSAPAQSADRELYRGAWTALYRLDPELALKKVPPKLRKTRAFARSFPQPCKR